MKNSITTVTIILLLCTLAACPAPVDGQSTGSSGGAQTGGTGTFSVVDTGQTSCYDANGGVIGCPGAGATYHGQDANYTSRTPSYTANGNGTVTDNVTGLMWTADYFGKMSMDDALSQAGSVTVGGYNDWRVPTLKELYSLIQFNGSTGRSAATGKPYLDTSVFSFAYGDESAGERFIDAQYLSSTAYVSTTMNGDVTVFGVNFADGRIKGYPRYANAGGAGGSQFVRWVRGNTLYGYNTFSDNGDGTITDSATGLIWLQGDSISHGAGTVNFPQALAWCENLDYAGRNDWRLPNAKELQGIVDYTRSPKTTNSAAIDPLFTASPITREDGNAGWGFYWTSTTHLDFNPVGSVAAYIAFGEAPGFMSAPGGGSVSLLDVHGAGAQRSDPKEGDPANWSTGFGPQGDVIRIYNLARCVRGGV